MRKQKMKEIQNMSKTINQKFFNLYCHESVPVDEGMVENNGLHAC